LIPARRTLTATYSFQVQGRSADFLGFADKKANLPSSVFVQIPLVICKEVSLACSRRLMSRKPVNCGIAAVKYAMKEVSGSVAIKRLSGAKI